MPKLVAIATQPRDLHCILGATAALGVGTEAAAEEVATPEDAISRQKRLQLRSTWLQSDTPAQCP